MPVPASFSSTIQSNNVRGAGHNVPPAPTTTAGSRPLDEYPRQTMNTAMMAGGAIVQVRVAPLYVDYQILSCTFFHVC
jgi:hypothetical protein